MFKIFLIVLFLSPLLYLVYLIIVYSRAKVPIIITPKKYFPVIFKNVEIKPGSVIYDLGCGRGDFLFYAEKNINTKKLVGFELSPIHTLCAKLKAKALKSKVKIYCKDFFKADISDADVIYLFLVKPVLIKTWEKIEKEVEKGCIIITLSDEIPGIKYKKVFKSDPEGKNSTNVYVYEK